MSAPLFILTAPRSLSALACAMIGNHPEMIGLAETNLLAAETYEELEIGYLIDQRFQHGLLRSVAELGLGGQTEETIELAKSWLMDNEPVSTSDIFRDLMAMAEPRHVVDTSILYIFRPNVLDRIVESFPEAYYLHLAMHPRLTCESIYRTRKAASESHLGRQASGNKLEINPLTVWMQPHIRILDATAELPPEQKLYMRGEDLLSQPEDSLRLITDWLDISSDDDAIEAMMHPEESPFAVFGPENAALGNDPHFLENPELTPFHVQPSDLDSPLSWDDEMLFDENLKELARSFGY